MKYLYYIINSLKGSHCKKFKKMMATIRKRLKTTDVVMYSIARLVVFSLNYLLKTVKKPTAAFTFLTNCARIQTETDR